MRSEADKLADAAEVLLAAMNSGTMPGAAWGQFLDGKPTAACRALMHRTDVVRPALEEVDF